MLINIRICIICIKRFLYVKQYWNKALSQLSNGFRVASAVFGMSNIMTIIIIIIIIEIVSRADVNRQRA